MPDEVPGPREPRVLRDLRVLRPEPRGVILYEPKQGEPPLSLPIRSILDFKGRETRRLLELFNPPPGVPDDILAQLTRAGDRVKLFCPEIPDDVLEEMTLGQRLAFEDGAMSAGPPPLYDALERLLEARPGFPCAEACDHPDCPALREVVSIRDKLRPPDPTPPSGQGSGPGASSPT